jgi:hypothetical protein
VLRVQWLTLLVIASVAITGCGKNNAVKKYKVSGTVTMDGKNVKEGRILFVPKDGVGPADGGAVVDGKYEFECTDGKKRVEIRATLKGEDTGKMPKSMNMPSPKLTELIPPKYNSETTLEANVTTDPSQNTFDFTLKK